MEIDIWNGKEGTPIVTHGNTLTKNYALSETVQFISKIAFKNNNYPLILSLEMHCNLEQRKKVA